MLNIKNTTQIYVFLIYIDYIIYQFGNMNDEFVAYLYFSYLGLFHHSNTYEAQPRQQEENL